MGRDTATPAHTTLNLQPRNNHTTWGETPQHQRTQLSTYNRATTTQHGERHRNTSAHNSQPTTAQQPHNMGRDTATPAHTTLNLQPRNNHTTWARSTDRWLVPAKSSRRRQRSSHRRRRRSQREELIKGSYTLVDSSTSPCKAARER